MVSPGVSMGKGATGSDVNQRVCGMVGQVRTALILGALGGQSEGDQLARPSVAKVGPGRRKVACHKRPSPHATRRSGMTALRPHGSHIGRATIPGRRDISSSRAVFASRNTAVRNDRPPTARVADREGDQLARRSVAKVGPGRRNRDHKKRPPSRTTSFREEGSSLPLHLIQELLVALGSVHLADEELHRLN
jgi:hypothetical protein